MRDCALRLSAEHAVLSDPQVARAAQEQRRKVVLRRGGRNSVLELRTADLLRDVRAPPAFFVAVDVEVVAAIDLVEEGVRALACHVHLVPELPDASAAYDDFLGLFSRRSGAALRSRRLGLSERDATGCAHRQHDQSDKASHRCQSLRPRRSCRSAVYAHGRANLRRSSWLAATRVKAGPNAGAIRYSVSFLKRMR